MKVLIIVGLLMGLVGPVWAWDVYTVPWRLPEEALILACARAGLPMVDVRYEGPRTVIECAHRLSDAQRRVLGEIVDVLRAGGTIT